MKPETAAENIKFKAFASNSTSVLLVLRQGEWEFKNVYFTRQTQLITTVLLQMVVMFRNVKKRLC